MSSDQNGSVGPRPARVARSATEWAAIEEDLESPGMSQGKSGEFPELSLKTLFGLAVPSPGWRSTTGCARQMSSIRPPSETAPR
ncbi:MAG: hypothetical protein OXF56_08885 [Rhodobacteraceae bacterium]|nr:hypothetical protein [Paracoccaceae bacterium]